MKNKPFDNTIIIIGADHHNTLAAIRAFGRENCDIKIAIHWGGEPIKLKKIGILSSKYANKKNSFIVTESEDALMSFLRANEDTKNKPILFPASDFAEMVIDKNFSELEKAFIIPGFKDKPGEVLCRMDKWNQYLFAKEHNIPMAPTFLIELNSINIPEELGFPCIVKPRISAYGSKSDIEICNDKNGLVSALNNFSAKGYVDALVQTFIHKESEACSFGCIAKNGDIFGGTIIKIREQLESGQSFSIFVIDNGSGEIINNDNKYEELKKANCAVLNALKESGYHGQYDVDFLICGNETYLNEINFRHSGNGYALINDDINAPFMWALSCLGKTDSKFSGRVKLGSYMMAELYDKMYVKRRVLTLREWIKDIKRTEFFAIYNRKDKCMAFKLYFLTAIGYLKKYWNKYVLKRQ